MTESNSVVDAFRERQFAALATVVSVEGSSYRRPGARMLITESGDTTGALSGGCLERYVCERAQKVMRSGTPVVVRYDTTNKDVFGTSGSVATVSRRADRAGSHRRRRECDAIARRVR